MQSKQSLKLLLLFLFLSSDLLAIEGKSRIYIKSNDTIFTSQKVTVAVELLSNAFSITDAKIIFPSSKKYIVQAPRSASYLGQEEINDEDWQMVNYEYEVYALQAGNIEIPAVLVSFTASMGYGQPKKEFELQSDSLSFDVKAPEGVRKDQFVLVTDNFQLISEVRPEKKKLIVGDAVELRVTQKAHGVPDILLTPIVYDSNAYLRVYEKEPQLQSGLDGRYDVSRTDSFTFVASMEGNTTLPAKEIMWYNPTRKKIHVEKVPPIVFEILPDPQIAIDAKKAHQKQLLFYIGSILLLSVLLYLLFASKIQQFRKERKCRFEESEAGKFAALLLSVESGDRRAIDRRYYLWLLSIDTELARGGMKSIEIIQPSFAETLKEFDQGLVDPDIGFDSVRFSSELKMFREKLLQETQRVKEGLPVTINP